MPNHMTFARDLTYYLHYYKVFLKVFYNNYFLYIHFIKDVTKYRHENIVKCYV